MNCNKCNRILPDDNITYKKGEYKNGNNKM